jgi:hypothetical protein
MLQDSIYELLTPVIFSIDTDTFVDGSSTGEYSLVNNTFELDTAETFVSTNLSDPAEFLDEELDISQVELSVKWNSDNIDDAADYYVSRDGGIEWQEVTTMERVGDASDTWQGTHLFEEESTFDSISSNATSNSLIELDDTNILKLGQAFTLTNTTVLKKLDIDITKNGSPAGYLWVGIASNDSGNPDEILAESKAVAISGLTTGTETIDLPSLVLKAGTYHLVIRTDAAYQASFATGTTSIEIDSDSSGTPAANKHNGTAWSSAGEEIVYDLQGRVLDLRVKVIASQDSKLEGFGVLYNNQTGNIITGMKNIEVFKFKAVADNDNEFTLTRFTPDPDMLKCFYVESGQCFVRPAFELQGNKIVFPVDTFNNGGVEADVTLIFQQIEGSGFDNSDSNALLLSENHLGSQDATIDRSANGRGIFLRTPSGELVELTIKDDYSIAIYSV